MQHESFISIQNVSKHFGKVLAVDSISIDIARGEFFSLLGPSGCGKTTLLRLLAGFEFPTSGEIFIDGQPMSSVAPNHRPVNMVFQSYAIFPHLNVKMNIGYSLVQDKLPKAEFDAKVGEMLELIKLPGYEDRASHELSGGERQRVALARALIRRPKVLLLDEPLGALDKKLRESMQLELRALQRSVGITFVFVTHDQEEALTMSDRVAVMSKGRYLQIDTPTQLYEAPQNREVADFIGTMNFFDARVREVRDGKVSIDAGPLGNLTVSPRTLTFSVGQNSLLAIRPEKIAISTERPKGRNAVAGVVDDAAYLGDRSYFYVRVKGVEKPVAVSTQNLGQSQIFGENRQEQIWLSWSDDAIVLLDSSADS
ncbi:MAG: ABC transporter ATP-binding protein [Arenicellales bacterium]|jgi:spermidine/putrescine ABC transporter ATP-binding subunit|nr:ABC transporter ATP-binding protein [Arenicellales bacterium]|tara:strand:+ start:1362 stop:2468 length:1107 start_codon:yes stop_codon:yes gene_type:complete